MIKNFKCLEKLTVYLLISICVAALTLGASPNLYAQQAAGSQILISPERVDVPLGESFTITVNLTNAEKLYTWQVVLKYNGTVVNCTGAWIPTDNVFSRHLTAEGELTVRQDVDGLNFIIYACSLIGEDSVNVANGILFKANFTATNAGITTITPATKEKPARISQLTTFYSYWLDSDFLDEHPLSSEKPCIVTVEGAAGNLPPSAIFIVQVPEIDTSNYLVLRGYTPVGVHYAFAYKDVPVIFNASGSKDFDGNITLYVWDFGDGNVTKTNDPIIVHVYHSTGRQNVVLTVIDNGNPPLNSTYSMVVVVGLLLKRFDWSPFLYGLAGVFLIGIAIYAIRKVRFKGRAKRG